LFSDQRIEYNYMNLPLYIADEDDSLVYTYGAGNNRIKARLFSGGQLVRTTWYGDNFERVVEGSAEKFYHWILSPDGPVALMVTVTGGSTTYYYLCRDHLNSITGIMDASGAMLEEYSYDPWGRRRSPADWLTTDVSVPGITTRGYTGHEHLDDFGLIHMNGRIYDPHVGRILNPDPIIQEPLNIQNYNRYSYCLNNPLKYTDPSGYKKKKKTDNNGCGVVGNTQKDREIDFSWLFNWIQGIGRGGSSGRQRNGGSGNSGGSEAFTYIPGIYTSFSAPYVSSFSGFGGGSGGTGSGSFGSGGSISSSGYSGLQPNGRILSLGNGNPTLWIEEYPEEEYYKDWGRYVMHIIVYGKMFSDYNWVQTYSYDNKIQNVETSCVANNGFLYPQSEQGKNAYGKANYQRNGDMFFYDSPNAHISFIAELSLFGKKNGTWILIDSFSWGYSVINGETIGHILTRTLFPSSTQRFWIDYALLLNNPLF